MTISFLDHFRARGRTASALLPQAAALPFPGLAEVRAYWEGLRRRNQLPLRSQLDPRGLAGALDRVFIAERIGRGLVQVRIAGSGLVALAETDPRGLPLSCLFAADSRPVLAQVLENMIQTPTVAELDLGTDRGRQGVMVARLLLLPLASDGGPAQVLGAFGFAPEGLAPCKLQVLARREERLDWPPMPVVEAPLRRTSHLTLVHSGA